MHSRTLWGGKWTDHDGTERTTKKVEKTRCVGIGGKGKGAGKRWYKVTNRWDVAYRKVVRNQKKTKKMVLVGAVKNKGRM